MRSLKSELLSITIKGLVAVAIGWGTVAYAFSKPARAPGAYTDNERANLTQFVRDYASKAPRKRRSQWKG